ncbi:MAG: hypothetical protein QOG20_2255, partial [Pseudonocardiales bacterium]|nr:hypothetical protein [Pseudonocardiales bacterium]
YAATPTVPQQVGARVLVEDPGLQADWPAYVTGLVHARMPQIGLLQRRLARPRTGGPLRWAVDDRAEGHVQPDVVEIGPGEALGTWDDATTAFFAVPVDPVNTGWELQVVRDRAAGEVALLVKVHHALGDGLAVTDALIRLLTDEVTPPARGRAAAQECGAREHLHRAVTVVRGVAALAMAGTAGPSPLTGRVEGPAHRRVGVCLDGARVRAAARAHGVGTTALMLAVLAGSLGEVLAVTDRTAHLRTMVPMTTRTSAGVGSHAPGNRTAAVSVALPIGPMPEAERVARVSAALTAGAATGEPEGAAAVLGLLGLLPGRVQAFLVRRVYGRRFFHMLASVMPGARRTLHIRGGLVREVYPVLPLADGVGLSAGVMHWGRTTTVGITADPGLVHGIEGIPGRLEASLERM